MSQGRSRGRALVLSGDETDSPRRRTPAPWLPTAEQAAFLLRLTDLLARHDPPVWELLEHGADGLAELLGDSCITSLLSDDGQWLHPLGLADPDPEVTALMESFAGTKLRADRGFARRVLQTQTAVRLPDTSPEVVRAGRPELGFYVQRHGIRSLIVAPMRVRGRAIGHVATLRMPGKEAYTEDDERLVQAVADWLAVGLESASSPTTTLAAAVRVSEQRGELSEREREILALVARGHTNREIAELLVLSVRTVEWHRARIQWKAGVSGRAALVTLARELGLAD